MTAPLGPRPELCGVDKRKLTVDAGYQRELTSARSRKLVEKIAAEFSWLKFQAITVTKNLMIVDGQHRHAAALLRADVRDLPCLVLPLTDLAAAAAIFVAINRERVALSPTAVFKAEVAAKSPAALALLDLCQRAGAEGIMYGLSAEHMQPNQTYAISTLRSLYAKDPEILQDAVAACVTSGVGVSAVAIKAAYRAFADGGLVGTVIAQLAAMKGVQIPQKEITEGGRLAAFYRMMTGEIAKPAPAAERGKRRKPFFFARGPAVVSAAPTKSAQEARTERERALKAVPVRRFEMGASGADYDYQLQALGYACKKAGTSQTSFVVSKIGSEARGRTMTKSELIAFIDKQRTAKGLQPLLKRSGT